GLVPGVDDGDFTGFGAVLMHFHPVGRHVERYVRHVQKIVREILLDHVALVAGAHDELVDAVAREDLHDVPQDRVAADLDHRLGPQMRFLADASAESPREYDGFHGDYGRIAAGAAAP